MSNTEIIKFVQRGVIFLIPIVLLLVGVEYYNKTRTGNRIISKLKLIQDYGNEINTLIIGNSHARNGFIASKFPQKTINAAIGGSTVYYSKEVLGKALKANKSGSLKNVVLTISYQTLFKDFSDESTLNKRFEFYHYLGSNYEIPSSFDLRKYSIINTISFHGAIENIINDFKGNPNSVYQNLGYTPYKKEVKSEGIEALSSKRIGIHHDMMSSNKDIVKKHVEDLEALIQLAKSNGIVLYIITPPVTTEYYLKEKVEYKKFTEILGNIAQRNQIVYYDFSNSTDIKELKYFKDSDHLNAKGAEKFTSFVLDTIKLN